MSLERRPIMNDDYAVRATALVISSDLAQAEVASAVLAGAGFRVTATMDLSAAPTDLAFGTMADVLAIEGTAQPGELVEAALAQVARAASGSDAAIIATIDEAMIDAAAALLIGTRSQLLCRPSAADRIDAAYALHTQHRARVHDATREAESLQLQRLNEEIARIAETLTRLTRGEDRAPAAMREPERGYRGPDDGTQCDVTAAEIRAVIRARRMRGQFFTADLFADPAWDMLLDLFAAELERCRVSVSSLCIAAAVPPTTALRWIGALHEAGLFERQADPFDRRRAYIALSVKALQGMQAYVTAVKRAGLSLV